MREYLFRGKRIDDGEWVYGDLIKSIGGGDMWILPTSEFDLTNIIAVIPETVGLKLPLKDFNGRPLFEDDIVSGRRTLDNFTSNPKLLSSKKEYRLIEFSNTKTESVLRLPLDISYSERTPENHICWKLAGNKFDNPELLQSL